MPENPKSVKIETDPVQIYINKTKILLEKLKQAELRFEESVEKVFKIIREKPTN